MAQSRTADSLATIVLNILDYIKKNHKLFGEIYSQGKAKVKREGNIFGVQNGTTVTTAGSRNS